MSPLLQDLRHAWRALARRPALALSATLTLALGVGAAAGMYGLVHDILLRPPPYPEADRLVEIRGAFGVSAHGPVVAEYVRRLDALERTALYTAGGGANVGDADPVRARVTLVSPDFFRTLGVMPALGRGFAEDDDLAGDAAVVSDAFWRSRLAGDAAALGTPIVVNGRATTLVGVMPPGIRYPDATDVWLPSSRTDALGEAAVPMVLGRLRPGVPRDHAEAALLAALREVEREAGRAPSAAGPRPEPIGERLRAPARRPLGILAGAAALVLLIACANVAGLLVARAVARRRELAVRVALGAGRWRLARQALLEGVLIGTGAALLGLGVAAWSQAALVAVLPAGVAGADASAIGGPVLWAAIAAGLITAVLASVAPAIRSAATPGRLIAGPAAITTPEHARFRRALIAVEVALAVVLLAGAGLLVRSMMHLHDVDLGFRPGGAIAADFHLPAASYPGDRIRVLATELDRRLNALPGVEAAAIGSHVPLGERMAIGVAAWPAGADPDAAADAPRAALRAVTSGYFAAIGAHVTAGRAFRPEDAAGPPVFVLSDVLARELWGEDPGVGGRLAIRVPEGSIEGEVVGVVRGIRAIGPDQDPLREVYRPFEHVPGRVLSLVVRSPRDPGDVLPAIRRELAALDPHVPLFNVRTLDRAAASAVADRRAAMLLLAHFAGVAVLLAGTGLYGLLAYLVARRTREIGVRIALGARRTHVVRQVLRQAAAMVVAGAVAGTLLALAGGRVMGALLYEVSPADPLAMIAAPAALVLFAFVAAALPARRAARIDPMEALRHD